MAWSALQGNRSRPAFEPAEEAAALIVEELLNQGPAEVGLESRTVAPGSSWIPCRIMAGTAMRPGRSRPAIWS